jgi:hypothetical protein
VKKTVYEKLAVELETLKLIQMAAKARVGYYSDFDSPLATPKMALVQEIRQCVGDAGEPLARRVMEGEFDG